MHIKYFKLPLKKINFQLKLILWVRRHFFNTSVTSNLNYPLGSRVGNSECGN